MAGCTVSVILFPTAMNLWLETGRKGCRGPVAVDGTRHPSCRAFMDNVTVLTSSIICNQWVLKALEKMANWGRMQFKPSKSRSLCLQKGKVTKHAFSVQGERIPMIQEEKITCLGKVYDSSLKDINSIKDVQEKLSEWLRTIDKSQLLGRFTCKVWCYQFGIIPRLHWPFLLYDINGYEFHLHLVQ